MTTHGRTKGRGNYSAMELITLLDTMEAILPIGPEEWQLVVQQHNKNYPLTCRDAVSIRRKYACLHRKKVPTGDPECPLEVKKAKRIKYAIAAKADLGELELALEEPPPQELKVGLMDIAAASTTSTVWTSLLLVQLQSVIQYPSKDPTAAGLDRMKMLLAC